jgi:hypothetical protein
MQWEKWAIEYMEKMDNLGHFRARRIATILIYIDAAI